MTLRELIEKLEEIATIYGDQWPACLDSSLPERYQSLPGRPVTKIIVSDFKGRVVFIR